LTENSKNVNIKKMKKFFILLIFIVLVGFVLINRFKEKIPFFKKQNIQVIEQQTPTPPPQLPTSEVKQSPEEKIRIYEEEVRTNPHNLVARFNLASAYSEKGDTALALFEFQEIIRIAPKSEEAKKAREWIKKQTEEAKVVWQNTVGKKVQEAIQIAQYTSITPTLKSLTEKIERERIPAYTTTTGIIQFTPPTSVSQPPPPQQPPQTYILIPFTQEAAPK
jgi:tetratricopeptide (TPR) repeat protein